MNQEQVQSVERIFLNRMKRALPWLVAGLLLACFVPGQAQPIVATERAASHIPTASQEAGPNTPGGGVVIGSNIWATDAVWGLRHYIPADPANPDPVDSGILVFDSASDGTSTGGGTALCVIFCSGGQVAYDGNQTIYVTAKDHPKGQPGSLDFPGVLRMVMDPVTGVIQSFTLLVPNAGLAGNLPTAIALGPDGNLYVGFEKNGNVVRITNPLIDPSNDPTHLQVVQSVGTSPNGRPIRGLAFVGPNLWVVTSDSLSVINNAVAKTCLGGCNATVVADGFTGSDHVGITTDGINRLYMSINGSGVWRFTINSRAMQLISTGGSDAVTGAPLPFAFVGGHSNLCQLDRLGNLWIGDDTSDGRLNFSGRLFSISAGQLASIP